MASKDLKAAAARGADLFFSKVTEPDSAETQPEVVQHRAQDEAPEQLAQTVQDMALSIAEREQERIARKAERMAATKAKHASMKRMNFEISPESYDYLRVMGGITGKPVNTILNEILQHEMITNGDTYRKAKELMQDARKANS